MTKIIDFGYWSLAAIEELNEQTGPTVKDFPAAYIPRPRSSSEKSPRAKIPPLMMGLRGETTYGPEVMSLINQECQDAINQGHQVWSNRLALLNSGNIPIIVCPRTVFPSRATGDASTSDVFAVQASRLVSEGEGKSKISIHTNHPVFQIVGSTTGNGIALVEDYQTSLLWPATASGPKSFPAVVGGRYSSSSLTKFVVLNPHDRSAVLSQSQGTLCYLNETARCTREMPNVNFTSAAFSMVSDVLFGFTEEGQLTFIDRRLPDPITLRCPAQKNTMTISPCNSNALFASWDGQQGLSIFDLRQLHLPIMSITSRYLGVNDVNHLQWLGEGKLLALDAHLGRLVIIPNIDAPRPCAHQIALDQSPRGIAVEGQNEHLKVHFLSQEDTITLKAYQELMEVNFLQIKAPKKRQSIKNQIKFLDASAAGLLDRIYEQGVERLSRRSFPNQLVPSDTPLDVMALSSACFHLQKHWPDLQQQGEEEDDK